MRFIFCIVFLTFIGLASAAQNFYLNRGDIKLNGEQFSLYKLNSSSSFDSANAIISLQPLVQETINIYSSFPRTVELTILETNQQIASVKLLPNTTTQFTIPSLSIGVYRYELKGSIDYFSGIKGVVVAGNNSNFIWRIDEMDPDFTRSFVSNSVLNKDYFPERFTVNGYIYPQTMKNLDTKVNCNVGDTIDILIFNAGYMPHSVHFHGYHVEIIASDSEPNQIGWLKDTFPVQKDRYCIVRLIPDKPGKYPVHDHYMGSVTTEGNYPGGMITMLDVSN